MYVELAGICECYEPNGDGRFVYIGTRDVPVIVWFQSQEHLRAEEDEHMFMHCLNPYQAMLPRGCRYIGPMTGLVKRRMVNRDEAVNKGYVSA